MSIIGSVTVPLKNRSYEVIVGTDLLADFDTHLNDVLNHPRIAVITDKIVADLHLPKLTNSLLKAGINVEVVEIPGTEASKNLYYLDQVLGRLLDIRIERTDTICALGGGVVGDLAGFAASIIKRGAKFVQIPTTLLAQVDAAIGGKTGINTTHGKNLVGTTYQPTKVIADIATLDTLPERELLAGYAEVVKYALIGDFKFFTWLEANGKNLISGNKSERAHAVLTCAQAKANIVANDEMEFGQRALLNLGHTFGHALEAELGYDGRLLHGEAVSIGMVLAFKLSSRLGFCSTEDAERVSEHLKNIGLPIGPTTEYEWNAQNLVNHMRQDKKVKNGEIVFVLPNGIGSSFLSKDIDEKEVIEVLEEKLSA